MRAARVPPQRFGWTSKANLRSVCAALDAVASMPKRAGNETGEWRPVEVKQVLCLTGGLSDTPIPLLETREVPTNNGPKLFVHFALYLPWVFQAVLGVQCRAHLTGRAATRTGLGGKVWKQLVDDFRVAARKQTGEASRGGAAVAALDDEEDDNEDEDPMEGLLAPAQPDEPKAPKPRSNKKVKVMGRLVRVPAKEKCPLAYPQDATERQVKMISLRKNEYWVAASDLGWLFERLRSENELAGVPLVEDGDADRAAVAAPVHGEDSQESALDKQRGQSRGTQCPRRPTGTQCPGHRGLRLRVQVALPLQRGGGLLGGNGHARGRVQGEGSDVLAEGLHEEEVEPGLRRRHAAAV